MKISILKLGDLLLTSLQEDLTDQDAVDFQQDLLRMTASTDAVGIVIDITSMEIVDSYMARILNDTANMVRLLGTEVVICGMQPAVALTLMEMGRELIGVEAALNLDLGIAKVRKLIDTRQRSDGPISDR